MTAISNTTSSGVNIASLAQQLKKPNAATAFIVSQTLAGISSSVRKDLLNNFYDKGMAQEFVASAKKWLAMTDGQGHRMYTPEGANLQALAEVIGAHREDFSPDEFTLGGPGSMTIQSAAMMSADIFKRQVDAKQADYDAQVAAANAAPDPDAAKLDALQKAVQTLVLGDPDAVADGISDAKAAYAILTQKLYPDDSEDDSDGTAGDEPPSSASAADDTAKTAAAAP